MGSPPLDEAEDELETSGRSRSFSPPHANGASPIERGRRRAQYRIRRY
jgi:hypothetical protein